MGAAPTPGAAASAKPQAAGTPAPVVGPRDFRPAVAEDDDAVAAPAPDAAVFAPRQSTAALVARQRLEHKRTLIPVLLTSGVLLPAIGSLKWLAGRDTWFADMELWVPLVMSAAGV